MKCLREEEKRSAPLYPDTPPPGSPSTLKALKHSALSPDRACASGRVGTIYEEVQIRFAEMYKGFCGLKGHTGTVLNSEKKKCACSEDWGCLALRDPGIFRIPSRRLEGSTGAAQSGGSPAGLSAIASARPHVKSPGKVLWGPAYITRRPTQTGPRI